MFENTRMLCKVFPALDPFRVRRTPAKEVFLLIRRVITQPTTTGREERRDSKGRIRRPAGDNWF